MNINRKYIGFIFIMILGVVLFGGYYISGDPSDSVLFDAIYMRGIAETTAQNLVTGIYLNYRLFDTLLEALLLLISVIAVKQFSELSSNERNYQKQSVSLDPRQDSFSAIMRGSLMPVCVLIALFGSYIILTGMDGPGGGFQGGAILVAILITAHFAQDTTILSIRTGTIIEKSAYVMILIVGMIFIACSSGWDYAQHRIYLVIINVLIGIKVYAGLGLIYMYFISANQYADKNEVDIKQTE